MLSKARLPTSPPSQGTRLQGSDVVACKVNKGLWSFWSWQFV